MISNQRRIKFVSPHGLAPASPPTGQAVSYRGPHGERFHKAFGTIGRIMPAGADENGVLEA
jgi:hypothetical protein